MAKANRFFVRGHHYHLTHRCHNGEYLLRFDRDRKTYRDLLRQYCRRYEVPLIGYCLTSNHVHLLVKVKSEGNVSEFMDALQGDFAQKYNLRKGRSGSFWNGRYHATAIESSHHLWECLRYIDLNMIRARVVEHPSEWPWCTYPELVGVRKRYRIVDQESFKQAFDQDFNNPAFIQFYSSFIQDAIDSDLQREPAWSESLAVGSREFVEEMSGEIERRIRLNIHDSPQTSGRCILKEDGTLYS